MIALRHGRAATCAGIASVACVLTFASVTGIRMWLGGGPHHSDGGAAARTDSSSGRPVAVDRLVACATANDSLLPPSYLRGFRTMVDAVMVHSPQHYALGFPPPLTVTSYLRGRLRGLVTEKAFGEPYIGESQAEERRLGYPVTAQPLVPLAGAIVHDVPGLLEVYELVSVFSTAAGAAAFQQGASSTATDSRATPLVLSGLSANAVASQSGGATPFDETVDHVDVLRGRVQLDLYLKGGRRLQSSGVAALVNAAVTSLGNSCHSDFG